MDSGSSDLTLAFELTSLKAFADPKRVFADARNWSEYVGIISDKPTYAVTNFTRQQQIRQDFFSGPRGREESLNNVRTQFGTDRHVFVGTAEADAELAELTGWEYLTATEAANAAGWELGNSETQTATADKNESEDEERDDWP